MAVRRNDISCTAALMAICLTAAAGFAEEPPALIDGGFQQVTPRINRAVPDTVRAKLEAGFAIAVDRVRDKPECRKLFADLGADGVEILSTTLYYKAELKMEKQVCPGAFGFTLVGGVPTWMCRRFARLNDERAAKVLLHEALHHAGVDEWPHDPEGMRASAIDALVNRACGAG